MHSSCAPWWRSLAAFCSYFHFLMDRESKYPKDDLEQVPCLVPTCMHALGPIPRNHIAGLACSQPCSIMPACTGAHISCSLCTNTDVAKTEASCCVLRGSQPLANTALYTSLSLLGHRLGIDTHDHLTHEHNLWQACWHCNPCTPYTFMRTHCSNTIMNGVRHCITRLSQSLNNG